MARCGLIPVGKLMTMYSNEEKIPNGYNGDVPPQPMRPVIKELEHALVETAASMSQSGVKTDPSPLFGG